LIGGLGRVSVPVGTLGEKDKKKPLPLPEFETLTRALSSSLTKRLQVMYFIFLRGMLV